MASAIFFVSNGPLGPYFSKAGQNTAILYMQEKITVASFRFEKFSCTFFQKYEPAAKTQLKKWQKIWAREKNKASEKSQRDVCYSYILFPRPNT